MQLPKSLPNHKTEQSMATPAILIADDNPGMQLGIKSALIKAGIENISEVLKRDEITPEVKRIKPEIMILGDRINGESSLELARYIRNAFPNLKILVSGLCRHEIIIWTFLELGISGYIVKENVLIEIVFAVQSIMNGGVWISPFIMSKVLPRFLEKDDHFLLT
jgi:DNA-binding NarL/FixJ family response regulator